MILTTGALCEERKEERKKERKLLLKSSPTPSPALPFVSSERIAIRSTQLLVK
jgi:hypothetical protein